MVTSAHAVFILVASARALTLPSTATVRSNTPLPGQQCSRRQWLGFSAGAATSTAFLSLAPPLPAVAEEVSGVKYTVIKTGNSASGKPVIGDLIAIRFKATVQKSGVVIDDILASSEPYYYRVGSGQVLPGVEKAVVNMRAGDMWQLELPPELAFGTKGRSSSPGKPRISGDAVIDFTLELVGVPGKDEEILEANGLAE
jgi:peptidylprolyl isomerase